MSFYTIADFSMNENNVLAKKRPRDLKWEPFQGLSIWYFWIPGQETKISKEQ